MKPPLESRKPVAKWTVGDVFEGVGKRKRIQRPEQALHIAVASFLGLALRPPTWWSSIEHATKLGPVAAAMRKKRGVKAGIADILIVGPHPNIAIELKSEEGDQSFAQGMFEIDWNKAGGIYYIARSVDEVEGFLRGVGVPLHATAMGRAA